MLYKLLIVGILFMNTVNASSNIFQNRMLSSDSFINNRTILNKNILRHNLSNTNLFSNNVFRTKISKMNSTDSFSNNLINKNLSNNLLVKNNNYLNISLSSSNSSTNCSIYSHNSNNYLYRNSSNSANCLNNNYELQEEPYITFVSSNEQANAMKQYCITHSNSITINANVTSNSININYNNAQINECFSKYCTKLTMDKAKQYLIKLYNEFNNLSNELENDTLSENKTNTESNDNISQKCIVSQNDIKSFNTTFGILQKYKLNNDNKIQQLSISQINNRLYLFVDIASNFIKVNKELGLNKNITDNDIHNISSLTELLYYENGLFTKDVLIKHFNNYKSYLINLLHPLI